MPYLEENYDAVVVGAGHAGCEAAAASANYNNIIPKIHLFNPYLQTVQSYEKSSAI